MTLDLDAIAREANKALALAGRYARLQIRSQQCKCTVGNLLDCCERTKYWGDGSEPGYSGCMEAYREWKSEVAKGNERRPNSQQGWDALLEQDLEFCRPCLLAMKVWSHRKTLHRRRASVLGSIKRIGVRSMAAGMGE